MSNKLTVLALHGYIQNKTVLEKSLIQLFKGKNCRQIKWIIPDGPYVVSEELNQHGWWYLPTKEIFRQPHKYEGIEESIEYLKGVIENNNPVDVVLGFSQGSVMASVLLSKNLLPGCGMAILMSGSDIQDELYHPMKFIGTKTILLAGEKDTLCTIDDSLKLAKRYENFELITHRWGHVIPTSSLVRDALLEHMTRCFSNKT